MDEQARRALDEYVATGGPPPEALGSANSISGGTVRRTLQVGFAELFSVKGCRTTCVGSTTRSFSFTSPTSHKQHDHRGGCIHDMWRPVLLCSVFLCPQVMHQAHKVLVRQAELLKQVFPPGRSACWRVKY